MIPVDFRSIQGKRMISRRIFLVWLGFLSVFFSVRNVSAYPIVVGPIAVNISSNINAIFSVTATHLSLTPLKIQWRRNGQNIPGTLTVSLPVLAATSLLTVTNAQPSDMGSYSAVVSDEDGVANSSIVSLTITNLTTILATNLFANRSLLTPAANGLARANNINATLETNEPSIDSKKGGSSVWMKWIAPSNGVARFNTRGSDFDTLLGVYRINPRNPNDVSVTNLEFIVGNDDDAPDYTAQNYFNSFVAFNAISNQEYEIAVDGFYGVQGHIVLNWSLTPSSAQVPVITNQPQNLTVTSNAYATFSVNDIQGANYQWFLNGILILGETRNTIGIPSVTAANVGEYRVLVSFPDTSPLQFVFSDPAQLQINSQGNSTSAAQTKFREATDPTSGPSGGPTPGIVHFHPNAVPVSGYTGSHIWNTYGAESEPGEPNHCNKIGGAPYWFSYNAPTNGLMIVDAYTPTFTNVLAVYTWSGGDFSGLNSVTCASTNAGIGHEVAAFTTTNGTTYYLVVDGLNGAVGNVTLSYNLINPPPMPPTIILQPQTQTVSAGSNVTLTVTATGSPTPSYQWRTNTVIYANQTNASLTVSNFQSAKEGNYDVVLTNSVGAVTSSVATLYLNSPVRFGGLSFNATDGFSAMLLGIANSNYVIQATTNLAATNWVSIATNKSIFGIISITDTNAQNSPGRYYRAAPQ